MEQQRATQDFLFSEGPGHREHASSHQYLRQVTQGRQRPVPQEGPQKSCNVGCVLHSLPPEGEAAKLYQPLSVAAQVLWSSSTLPCSFLFSVAARHLEDAIPHQHAETGDTEASPSGSSPEKSEYWTMV